MRARLREPSSPKKIHGGKIQPRLPTWGPVRPCYLCGKNSYSLREYAGTYWCFWHDPRNAKYQRKQKQRTIVIYVRDEDLYDPMTGYWVPGKALIKGPVRSRDNRLSKHDLKRQENKVDAGLGRKKFKRNKTKKVSRDRAYIR